jgi:PAS domain S-box-containing protein
MPNSLLQTTFQTGTIGMAFVGLDGQWKRVNSSLCDMLGYSERELLALKFQSITPPEDIESDSETASGLFRGEMVQYQGEQRFFHKNGGIVWVALGACLVRDENGEPQCFFADLHDITDRKGVEKIREAIFELPTSLHFVAGFDGYFKKLSPSWVEALGYPLEYLLSIPYLDLVHPDDRMNTTQEAKQVADGFNTFLFENRYRHADGSYRWILWTSISKTEEELVYGVALDYTTRKEMELDLERTLLEARSLVADLTASQKEITKLREGLLTVCAWTKRIRYEGRWMAVDEFLRDYLHLNLTHGISEEAVTGMMAEDEDRPE